MWGLFSVSIIDGCRFLLIIVDDCSMCTWVYLLKHKSQTQFILEQFYTMVETHNLQERWNALEHIMVLSLLWKVSFLKGVSCINSVVLKLHNKMLFWKESINTSWMLQKLWSFGPICPCIFGDITFSLLYIWSTEFQLQVIKLLLIDLILCPGERSWKLG